LEEEKEKLNLLDAFLFTLFDCRIPFHLIREIISPEARIGKYDLFLSSVLSSTRGFLHICVDFLNVNWYEESSIDWKKKSLNPL